jgi:hypothetical protein
VAVLIYSGTLTPEQREAIWRRGKRQNSYYVAFLELCPNELPPPSKDAFVEASIEILSRPDTQEVVSRTLDAIGRYFSTADITGRWADRHEAIRRLGQVDAALADPVFARSTAIGSLMRRKIEPVIKPVLADLALLLPG